MNFKISKRIFYNSLQVVDRAISPNSPLPALSGIKIDVEEDSLTLTGSDADISIRKVLKNTDEDLNLVVNETGSIVIESKILLDLVRKIDADEITFEIVDGSLTKLSGASTEFKINGMRSSDYPTIDFTTPNQSFTLDADTLMKIITQTSFATSDKETRPVLTGVNFRVDGTKMECVATDSYRLARKFITIDSENKFNITIPAKSLREVSKSIERDTKCLIAINDKKVQFDIDNTLIQSRLIDGAYPETDRLIPTEFKHEMVLDSRDIVNAIDRASVFKNEGISIVRLSASEDEVLISSKSQEVGESKEVIRVTSYIGDPLEISFSGNYVLQAVRTLSTTSIKIQFSGDMKPFIITNPDDDSILQLVLPVRTYN